MGNIRPIVQDYKIIYPFVDPKNGKKYQYVKYDMFNISGNSGTFNGALLTKVAKGFEKAPMDENGNISPKTANIMLKEIFNSYDYLSNKILFTKDIFDLCTSEESEGGKNITQEEQKYIMNTVFKWGQNAWVGKKAND